MLEGKGLIEDTDMPVKMQIQAMASASQALDLYDVLDCKSIAAHIKKGFDMRYGVGWQCVVGSNFGCFFTHSEGSFIYFTLETLNFLIFKRASSPSSFEEKLAHLSNERLMPYLVSKQSSEEGVSGAGFESRSPSLMTDFRCPENKCLQKVMQ